MAKGIYWNKVLLIGNLGKDPEMKYTSAGTAVCKFSIATSERFKDRDGNQQERTEWHRITAWGKLAEICGQYLSKGRQVFVEGSLRTNSWEDQQGNKRSITEIVAKEVQFLGGGKQTQQQNYGSSAQYDQGGYYGPSATDDDLPF